MSCFDDIVLCFNNTVLCFDNIVMCFDNTVLCLEKCLLCFKNCLLCLQIWATVFLRSACYNSTFLLFLPSSVMILLAFLSCFLVLFSSLRTK